MSFGIVSAVQLREWLHDGHEIAVIDVSEGGPFTKAHILIASNVPPAQLEVLVPALVPRLATRLVLTSSNGTETETIASLLGSSGYSNVFVLAGGNLAWSSAGFRLFSGSNIVSKAFGELVEAEFETPHIEVEELARWFEIEKNFYFFDSRPLAEFRTVSLPGGTNCPGGELVYRASEVASDPKRPIVVNCAGRTRSIIGAQSLRDAGFPNPIFALKNGTMGWQIAGFAVEKGRTNILPEPKGDGLLLAIERARNVATSDGIRFISFAEMQRFIGDSDRTTYLLDVRQPDAFARGHVTGSINAPGGQLAQATDTFVAVWHSRLILIDDYLVQSVMSAHWLSKMGWDVWILKDAIDHMTDVGLEPLNVLKPPHPDIKRIRTDELQGLIETKACEVIDVGESYWYRQGRIPGSWYSKRSDLSRTLQRFDAECPLVFVCTRGATSPYAAGDAIGIGFSHVGVLEGGRTAWQKAGNTIEVIDIDDDAYVLSITDDMWYPPWSRKEGVREAMIDYLTWEVGLTELVAEETYLSFRV